jgi:hypothetical protein
MRKIYRTILGAAAVTAACAVETDRVAPASYAYVMIKKG